MKLLLIISIALQACGSKETPIAAAPAPQQPSAPLYCSVNDCDAIANELIKKAKKFHCGPEGSCVMGYAEFESKKCGVQYSYCCSNGPAFYGVREFSTKNEAVFDKDIFIDRFDSLEQLESPIMATGTADLDQLKKAISFGLDQNLCQ